MNPSVKSDEELVALLARTMHSVADRAPDMDVYSPNVSRSRMVSVAAAMLLVAGAGAAGLALTSRDGSTPAAPSAVSTVPVDSTTIDPLRDLDIAADALPADATLVFTSPLGQFGQVWMYDSLSTDYVYFLRRGPSGDSFGSLDRATYELGQGWMFEANHGTYLLYGLTSPSVPVAVTFGSTTVTSDENGLWYTQAPKDLPGFTLRTAETSTYIDLVTSNEVVQTTLVTQST